MRLLKELHNKNTLASSYNLTPKQFRKKLKVMLSDQTIKKEFGTYSYPFTPKQLSLIIDNIGEPPENNKK